MGIVVNMRDNAAGDFDDDYDNDDDYDDDDDGGSDYGETRLASATQLSGVSGPGNVDLYTWQS